MFFFLDSAKKALLACREFLHTLADDQPATRPKRALSAISISTKEKENLEESHRTMEFNEKDDFAEATSKEVEARLELELVGDGSNVMLVREDGTVVDDNPIAPGHGGDSTTASSSEDTTPAATVSLRSRSRSGSVGTKGKQNPQLRDGTCVDTSVASLHDDPDYEEPDSPISFKPRRRSPGGAKPTGPETGKTLSRTSSSASIGTHYSGIRPKTPIPVPSVRRRTSGYFPNSPNSLGISVSPAKSRTHTARSRSGSASSQHYTPAHAGILNRNHSIGSPSSNNTTMSALHLTKRRTQMNLSLTTTSPYNPTSPLFSFNNAVGGTTSPGMTTPTATLHHPAMGSPLLSPSIPSIRKRERATSHPDIFRLCQSWAELGPANDLVVIEANPQGEDA